MKCPQIPVLSRVQTRTFSLFWVSSLFPWPLVPWACSLSSPPLLPPFHKQLYRAFVSSALVQWNTNTIWQGSGAFLLGLLYKHPFGMQSRAWAKLSSGVFFSAKCTYMGPYLGHINPNPVLFLFFSPSHYSIWVLLFYSLKLKGWYHPILFNKSLFQKNEIKVQNAC